MITNKDIRVENGFLIINGNKYPLDGQSPESIMAIVEDNSDTTPTENSDAPITSGGVFAADKDITDTIGDLTQTGVTGSRVADQLETLGDKVKITTITPSLATGFGSDNGSIIVSNGVCYFAPNFFKDGDFTVGTVETIGTLPNNCKPKVQLRIACYSATAEFLGILMISSQGEITYYPANISRYFGYCNAAFEVQ